MRQQSEIVRAALRREHTWMCHSINYRAEGQAHRQARITEARRWWLEQHGCPPHIAVGLRHKPIRELVALAAARSAA